MLTPEEVCRLLLQNFNVIVSFTNRSLSIRCLRKTNKTLKNSTSCTSDLAINVDDNNMQFIAVTTCITCIQGSFGTRSNVDPLYTRKILTLRILIADRSNCCSVGVSIINTISCCKCNTILIQSNIATTLNTTSSNIASVSSLSYRLRISNDASNTTRRKCNLKFLVCRIPRENCDSFVRTTDVNSCRSARNEITDNSLNS